MPHDQDRTMQGWFWLAIAAAVVALAGAVVFFVPLSPCPLCDGVFAGIRPDSEYPNAVIFCGCCKGDARLTLARRWAYQLESRRYKILWRD